MAFQQAAPSVFRNRNVYLAAPPRPATASSRNAAATFDQKLRATLVAAVRARRLSPAQAQAVYARESQKHARALQAQRAALAKPPVPVRPSTPDELRATEAVVNLIPGGSVVTGAFNAATSALGLDQMTKVDVTDPASIDRFHADFALLGSAADYEAKVDAARAARGLPPYYAKPATPLHFTTFADALRRPPVEARGGL